MKLDDLINFYDSSVIISALKEGGGEPRFVGGCVRNILSKTPVNDVDVATILLPDQVEEVLSNAGIKTLDIGKDHGTIIAVLNERIYEITTLRKDVKTDGRHAVVEFSKDWKEDAERRDFTINAMSYDPYKKKLYDYYGGEEDLKNGIVKFVGEPNKRVQEDYLRILRFFRFHAIYSQNNAVDKPSLKACEEYSENIKLLSAERKREEFIKILLVDHISNVLEMMFKKNILSDLFGQEITNAFSDHMSSLNNVYLRANQTPPALLKIYLIAEHNNVSIESLSDLFHFSRSQTRYMKSVKNILDRGLSYIKDNLYLLIYRDSNVLLDCIYYISAQDGMEYSDIIEEVCTYLNEDLVLPVSGEDIMDTFNIPTGAGVGEFLKDAEIFWCNSRFKASKKEVISFLKGESK